INRKLVEHSLALREDFTPTPFYASDAFYRGILDLAYVYEDVNIAMIDHKSGERYPNPTIAEQLEGYAVLVALSFRAVRRIWLGVNWVADAEVVWTPALKIGEVNHTLVPKLLANIEAAALAVDAPRPNPGAWCERCNYRSICPAG